MSRVAAANREPVVENGKPLQFGAAYNGRSNGGARLGTSSEFDPNANEVTLQQPPPLFERLVTEEVQELRAYVRIVENQNRRLLELERVHCDLEARLEVESKGRQRVEATLEVREREWAEKFERLESDRDKWKRLVDAEQIKNSKLIDQVVRKEQDIHRMLQRKVRKECRTLYIIGNVVSPSSRAV
jgi:hypothetical protein